MKMKKKILVVEDNLILCDILERWLLKAGYEVMTAADEPSARGKIKKHETALVLTDVRLPEGDGISLLEWSVRQKQFIPFVVMTEYASIADAVRAVKLGAKDYLPKPVYEEQLLELLRGLLKPPVAVTRDKTAGTLQRGLTGDRTDCPACGSLGLCRDDSRSERQRQRVRSPHHPPVRQT